ncbi:T9SS sorting signal type C domain-containing protein [Flavobacterium subsaxonicum]|uniref:PA14 domain-containing protein n=1 Tax=Flavobacterium subsaxonicum WB 4.1-42 = DSM 21790 TaxID=1121898 RepID=A0A0A2MVH7_9FLAO|nr:T9SS sorting signal type C domain-containing protein [Flavobacterium subsaxonicum]KGO92205.1 hypothetical protein Q766_13665 [Flavobacterium subsaxonicum WB 4.1-42 = DSM 21790]
MNYIYPNFTNRYLRLALLAVLFVINFQVQAQCSFGNQTTFGTDQWYGYVYNNIPTGNPPATTPFVSANYRGYVTRAQNFDQNLGNGAIPAEATLCTGTYNDNFAIRYKMTKNLAAGYYTYIVGGDDGYRLSINDGEFITSLSAWDDHSYGSKTATIYHAGGTINYILEYYERGTDSRVRFNMAVADCTTTAPESITSTGTSSCTTTTTLTATGGTVGTNATYQWGIGSVAGNNIISGATTASITVQPLSTKTYWVRRVAASPCSNTTDAAFKVVTPAAPVAGNPSEFGSNAWNVYGYKGESISLASTIEYAGFYTASTLSFDTTASWPQNASPSSATATANSTAWSGCTIPVDNFTFVSKRQGFPCGNYSLVLNNWDDEVIVYVNGTSVYTHNGYSGGAGGAQTLGNFNLSETSTIEIRIRENGGDANAKLTITNTTTAPTGISGTLTVGCGSESTTLTATGGTGSTYQWGTGDVVGVNPIAGATTASITVSPSATTKYWVRRVATAPCTLTTTGVVVTVTRNTPLVDPSTFGAGVWNVYAYNGVDIATPSNNVYRGSYSVSTLGFDTTTSWGLSSSPSSATGYQGCSVNTDNFTFIHKRKGFNCGSYKITLNKWDDAASMYIDGTLVWSNNAWSGDAEVSVVVGTYQLGPNSTIEFRTQDNATYAVAKVTIAAVTSTDAASIAGASITCKDASITLTATGASLLSNTEYQWGTGTIGQNIIAGQTGASIVVAPSATTTYWVRIKNTICGTTTAGTTKLVTVPAAVTYTNGTWSATPSINTPVEIVSGNLEVTSSLQACSCLVKANATVAVNTGATFTIKRKLTVEPNALFLTRNNGALVQIDDNIVNEGSIRVVKNTNQLYRLDYTMWSAPVTGQQLGLFSVFTSASRFYVYGGVDASNNYTDGYTSISPNNNFDVATGYLIRMPNSVTGGPTGTYYQGTSTISFEGTFKGLPNNGTINKTLNTLGGRYTAVGNPYSSPISVKDFYTQNSGVLDGTSAMYLWRKKNDHNVSSYATLTLAGLVANGASPDGSTTVNPTYLNGGQDQAVFFTGTNSDNANWLIAPGQGFIVRTQTGLTNPQLTFNNTMRRAAPTTGAEPFFKVTPGQETSRLWLNLTTEGGFSQTAVAYIPGATTGLDYGYDGVKLTDGNNVALYTLAADNTLTIQARPAFTSSDEVALGFTAKTAGSYTIDVDHVDGVFAEGQSIYLRDSFTGVTHDITSTDFTFTTEAGTFDDRFTVLYAQPTQLGTDNPVITANSVVVYQQDNTINIASGNIDMTDVTIYDIRGRKLYNQSNINATTVTVTNLAAQQQVLIVEITTVAGKVSKKIVY